MSLSKLIFAGLVGGAASFPSMPFMKRQISDPNPVIPLIPGVTEPLSKNAPPLPILQAPTPPLPEVPYTPSNIKPKKIGYFWTASGDNEHADFLASFSLDDATFGTLLRLVPVPTSGNSPHHLGVSADGKYLWGGGLLSLLKTQDTGFYFDVTDPYNPTFKKSDRATLSSIADDVVAKPGGGFFFAYMGSALGTSPGRLVETDENYNIIHQWPEDYTGTMNILGQQFNPHGLAIDFKNGYILTSDFVVPASVLKPTLGPQRANTLRLWDLATRTIINTITVPNGQGMHWVDFIPGNPDGAALTTAVGAGQLWLIYPNQKDTNGKPGRATLLYDMNPSCADPIAIYSAISHDGKYFWGACTTDNRIIQLDISDLNNVKRLDDPKVQQPIVGPHFSKLSPDGKNLLITDYFLQTGDIGVINTPADFKAQWTDVNSDGSLNFNRTINFSQIFANRGGAKPHSSVVFDLTDPSHPRYA